MTSGTIDNPNGLETDRRMYVQGVTILFAKKDGETERVFFERFDRKNGKDVIYVRPANGSKSRFYPFPNTRNLFPNKDDAAGAVGRENRMYQGATSKGESVRAFLKLPKSLPPDASAEKERAREKEYHSKVDGLLKFRIEEHRLRESEAHSVLNRGAWDLREEIIAARENGSRLDDHTWISSKMRSERANQTIAQAGREIAHIETMRAEPYFARVDCGPDADNLHTAYIGEHDIADYVIDWRHSDIGNAYYHTNLYQGKDGIYLALKRIFQIRGGVFLDFSDEINLYQGLDGLNSFADNTEHADALLNRLLSESRKDKTTHDIIKTIQSEQYDIITSDFGRNALVNGCAGSGKTMIMYNTLMQ